MKKFISMLLGIIFFVCLAVSSALAFTVELGWSANTELDLAGYRVYASTTSKVYDLAAGYDVGLDGFIGFTVPDTFEDGVTHYFVITALNAEGLESGFSNEVCTDGLNTGGHVPDAPGGCYIRTIQ